MEDVHGSVQSVFSRYFDILQAKVVRPTFTEIKQAQRKTLQALQSNKLTEESLRSAFADLEDLERLRISIQSWLLGFERVAIDGPIPMDFMQSHRDYATKARAPSANSDRKFRTRLQRFVLGPASSEIRKIERRFIADSKRLLLAGTDEAQRDLILQRYSAILRTRHWLKEL